ncbi:phasin family protein [Gulbenkiania mobilis]|uniref:Phasin family protein n=1 Tax=Gulbenkiania mobilis TaxID=397457 RepID=A0ABY2D1C9_GULMO|nr:phasin family protein [Gulbenkiania mobilis]TCW33854.1 phasin family protein [Gulbenkiania mobilis]
MVNNTEQLNQFSMDLVEGALRFAQLSLDSTERLMRFQFEASKQILEENVAAARQLTQLGLTAEAMEEARKYSTQAMERSLAQSRTLYDIASQVQGDFTRLAEDRVDTLTKSLTNGLDHLSKNAPAGSETAVNVAKSSLATATAAMSSLSKVAKQMAEFTDTNVKAASHATVEAVKTVSRRAPQGPTAQA